ncbi:hypothetical protein B566_EDAN003877 [Ephemera danica]|nr:hypothetical protein B566_EDAN003877 [Ephemera danica]
MTELNPILLGYWLVQDEFLLDDCLATVASCRLAVLPECQRSREPLTSVRLLFPNRNLSESNDQIRMATLTSCMGTSTSRRMDDSDSRSRSDDSVDQDSDLATILQFLIRSGQVHIISSERDIDGDEDFVAAASPPRISQQPNTELLDEASGMLHPRAYARPTSIPAMVQCREVGMFGKNRFLRGDCCKIYNNFIPNHMETVAVYPNKAFCGTYSADGKIFLSACQDRNLRLYHAKEGQFSLFNTIQARDVGWSILDTAFSPDGQYVVYSSWSECIHLVNIHGDPDNQEALPLSPDDRRFCIFSLAFSEDGREILGGGNDGYLYVYDRECQQRCLRIEGHDEDVNTVAFADSTSQILYSGGDDGLCRVWDRRTLSESHPKPVGVLAGHMDGLTYIDPRGDGRHLLTNCKDQSIKLWDMRVFSPPSGQENTRKAVLDQMLQTLVRCHFSPAFTTGQRYIYTGCAAGRVVVYDVLTGQIEKTLAGHRACVRDWDGTLGRWTYKCASMLDDDDDDVEMEVGVEEELKGVETTRALRRSPRIAQRQMEREKRDQQST